MSYLDFWCPWWWWPQTISFIFEGIATWVLTGPLLPTLGGHLSNTGTVEKFYQLIESMDKEFIQFSSQHKTRNTHRQQWTQWNLAT